MKTKVLEILDKRLKEHLNEKNLVEEAIKKLQEENKGKTPGMEFASKVMILKDRIIFNRGCIILLEDLIKEFNNEQL